MCSNNATLLEGSGQQFEVWLLEQALCWSLWVGRIGDDNIKLILVIIQEFESISNVSLDFWVLVTDCHPGKVLLGETDHGLKSSLAMSHKMSIPITYLINIAQDSLLDALMLDDLTQDASITATNDQKRIATPATALAAGASMLVVGRPITQAADPRAAALAILAEMAQVL